MEKKKSIIASSLIAGAFIAVSGFAANASSLFSHNSLGTAEELRTNLLTKGEAGLKSLDLKCGGKGKADSTAKKGKEGKCGEGKCGEGKCGNKKTKAIKKGKEGKCGEGKCGDKKTKPKTKG